MTAKARRRKGLIRDFNYKKNMARKTMRNVSGGAYQPGSVVFEAITEYGERYESWQAGFNRACDRFLRERVEGYGAAVDALGEKSRERWKRMRKPEGGGQESAGGVK